MQLIINKYLPYMSDRIAEYEILYFTSIMLSPEDILRVKNEVNDIIVQNNGSIVKYNEIGKKKLSYSIKHHRHGYFISSIFQSPAENIEEIKNKIKLLPDIIRFRLVIARKPDPLPTINDTVRPLPKSKNEEDSAPVTSAPKTEKVDLKELDLKIDELLSSDNI